MMFLMRRVAGFGAGEAGVGLLQRAARQHGGEMLAVGGRRMHVVERLEPAAAFAGVAEEIARLRGVPVETIAEATSANFFRLFGIRPDAH